VCCLSVMLWTVQAQAQMLTGYSRPQETQATPIPSSAAPQPVQVVDELPDDPNPDRMINASPVDFQADKLEHDDQTNIITASGNVMLVQNGRILRADQVTYDLSRDIVTANGHVVLNEESGDIFYADSVTLQNNMKDGVVTTLKTYLADGSRFWAESGQRIDGKKVKMDDVAFTPCQICEEGETPAWQIKASEVTHDKTEHKITYKNARFEFFGVPLAYTPYFAHPDGTVEQKSGFLAPILRYKSDQGASAHMRYYWGLAPDQDVTIGVIGFTQQMPMLTGEYRSRWENAYLKLQGAGTYAEREDSQAGVTVTKDEEFRGHIFAEGLWDLNQKWRVGTNIALASDDQYMNEYDFSSEDVLTNELYAERFVNRDYTAFRLMGFQDLRVNGDDVEQPMLFPEVVTSFIGEPGSVPVLGGRAQLDGSYLGLRREGEGQDVDRIVLNGVWDRRFISDVGFLLDVNASARGDLYHINDNEISVEDSSQTKTRFFPQATFKASYPLMKSYEQSQVTVEPVVSLTLAPNLDVVDSIPNEDSQDVQIDASNLFEANRFPGYDRIEDQSHVTYGMRTGIYGYSGSYANVFLGQSHRIEEDDNPFPYGSGLSEQDSDIVGQISGSYDNKYDLDYRFQLRNDNLASQRHEVTGNMDLRRFSLGANYLFAKALEGTVLDESREQLSAGMSYYWAPDWRSRIGATQDLGDSPGLREAYIGLDYMGECMSWSLTGERNLTDDNTGESSTEIMFTLGLKNLGEFEKSAYREEQTQGCELFYQ